MAGKREVTKLEKPIHVFSQSEEWRTVDSPESAILIHRALEDPIRVTILGLLDEGPIRQIDLTRIINRKTGRRYGADSIMHHLGLLEKAGLVTYADFPGKQTKIKMIYRTKDVKLQVCERPKLDVSPAAIDNIDEWLLEFKSKKGEGT